jgi:LEA14-like dessication related protein
MNFLRSTPLAYIAIEFNHGKMKLLTYLSLIVLSNLFLSSCREPKDLEFREFKNLTIENLSFSKAILKVDLVYYNPNNFGLELNRTDLDLYVDSSFLGHSSQNIQVAIPKRDVFTLPLQVDLDMKNLLKNGLNSLFSKEIAVRLLGKVKVGKAGVYKNFSVDYTTRQNFSLFK